MRLVSLSACYRFGFCVCTLCMLRVQLRCASLANEYILAIKCPKLHCDSLLLFCFRSFLPLVLHFLCRHCIFKRILASALPRSTSWISYLPLSACRWFHHSRPFEQNAFCIYFANSEKKTLRPYAVDGAQFDSFWKRKRILNPDRSWTDHLTSKRTCNQHLNDYVSEVKREKRRATRWEKNTWKWWKKKPTKTTIKNKKRTQISNENATAAGGKKRRTLYPMRENEKKY